MCVYFCKYNSRHKYLKVPSVKVNAVLPLEYLSKIVFEFAIKIPLPLVQLMCQALSQKYNFSLVSLCIIKFSRPYP